MALPKILEKVFRLDHADPEKAAEVQFQSPELLQFAAEIREEFLRRVEERRPFEQQWRLNQNFVLGNQYCDIVIDTGLVEDLPLTYDNEMRSVYNQIGPIEDIRLAKLARVQPGLLVRPMTSDTRDITCAKTSTRIMKATYIQQKMLIKGKKINNWLEYTGGCLFKSVWNPNAGKMLGIVNGRPVYEGDLETLVVPYYEFFPSTCYQEDLQEMDSVIHAKAYTVDQVRNRWGIEVEGQIMDVYSLNTTGATAGGIGFNGSMPTIEQMKLENSVLVIEYFERPSVMFPQGRHAIVVGDVCVHLGVLNFRVGDNYNFAYPFTHVRCLDQPGVFWGTTVVERCIPVQRTYNAVQNMIDEYMARMSIGNPLIQEGSVDEDIMVNGAVPGQVIAYKQGYDKPTYMSPEETPQTLPQRIQDLRQEFVTISGVSEMARTSQVPASISSGNALEALKEQDDTRLTLTAENIRQFFIETGQQWLRLFKQYAVSRRISRVVGDDFGDIYGFLWDQNDITSDDVTLDTENEMMNTPAQRKQNALDLLKAGLFNDPDTGKLTREGRAKVLEIYGLGNTESMINLDEKQIANAQRENLLAMYNGELEIMPYDNHSLHLSEHMSFALGAEFRELRMRDPAAAQAFLDHLAQHKESAVQEALAMSGQGQVAPQMVANGQPMDAAMSAQMQNTGDLGSGQ